MPVPTSPIEKYMYWAREYLNQEREKERMLNASNYGTTRPEEAMDTVHITIQRVVNGHIVTAYQNPSSVGSQGKQFTRVVPSGGDLIGEIAAVIADVRIS